MKKIILVGSILFYSLSLWSQQNYTWTGAISQSWEIPGNWSPNGVPSEMDTVVITTSTVDASTGNPINIAALYFLGGTITGTDSISISDTISWTTGRFDGLGSTTFMKGSRAFMHGVGGRTISARNINWHGDGHISGTGTLSINGAELSIGGTLIIAGIGNIYGTGVNGIVPKITVEEGAVLIKNGIDFINSLQFDVKGRLELDSGTLELRGNNNWTGEFSGAENTTLLLSKATSTWLEGSTLTTAGNCDFATTLIMDGNCSFGNRTHFVGNSEHSFNGTIADFGDSLIISGGTNHFNSDITLPYYTYIDGGTNYGAGTITVIDTLIWNNGGITDTGYIHITEGAVALLSGEQSKLLWRKKIINEGTFILNEGALQMTSGSEFQNHGSFMVPSDGSMAKVTVGGDTGGAVPTIFNRSDGVFIKKGGSELPKISGINFFNEGLVELDHTVMNLDGYWGGGFYTQTSGYTRMDSSRFIATRQIRIDSGLFMGSGFVDGDLYNAGIVDPGSDSTNYGVIYVNGIYTQDITGTLVIDIGGRSPQSGHDQLTTNTASLAGLLDLQFHTDSLFNPYYGTRFRVMRWLESVYEGSFDSISNITFTRGDISGGQSEILELDPVYSINDLTIFGSNTKREMWFQFIGRKFSRPGRKQNIKMYYGNTSRDTLVIPMIIELEGNMNLSESQYVHFPDWVPWESPVDADYFNSTVPDQFEVGPSYWKIPLLFNLPPVDNVSGGSGSSSSQLVFQAIPACEEMIPTRVTAKSGDPLDSDVEACLWGIADELVGLLPGGACVQAGLKLVLGGMHAYSDDLNGKPQTWGGFMAGMGWDLGKCAVSFIPGASLVTKTVDVLDEIMGGAGRIGVVNDCGAVLLPNSNGKSASKTVFCATSTDPNEKVGPDGVSYPRYFQGNDPSAFTIYFENVDTATAPAQNVYITDQLNTEHWDLSTFSFLPVTIGDTTLEVPMNTSSFEIDADLRDQAGVIVHIAGELNEYSGLVIWTFTSLDTITHQPVTDPLAGFLPPNVNYPDGQADVGYLVQPNLDLLSGTEIGTDASIIFDTNDAILTNTWINTIDRDTPVSQMVPFSGVVDSEEIPLRWSGQDQHSGILGYRLFVSENGMPFKELLSTSDTSYLFVGKSCTDYQFYTLAVDSVGNKEAPKDPEVLFTINPYKSIEIIHEGSLEFCLGDSVLLKAPSAVSLSYKWFRDGIEVEGANDSLIYIKESGSYSVNVNKNEICTGLSTPVSVTVNDLPEVSLSVIGNILSAQEGFQQYQWYLNGAPLADSNNNSLVAETSGEYAVRVTDLNGCVQISVPYNHLFVGVDEIKSEGFLVYPNPANDNVNVVVQLSTSNPTLIEVMNFGGRIIYQKKYSQLDSGQVIEINTSAYGSGNYIIRISGKDGTKFLQFTKL